jgi:hypothetical protein
MGQDLAIFTIYTKRWSFINLRDTLREGGRYTSVKSLFDNYIKNNQQKGYKIVE